MVVDRWDVALLPKFELHPSNVLREHRCWNYEYSILNMIGAKLSNQRNWKQAGSFKFTNQRLGCFEKLLHWLVNLKRLPFFFCRPRLNTNFPQRSNTRNSVVIYYHRQSAVLPCYWQALMFINLPTPSPTPPNLYRKLHLHQTFWIMQLFLVHFYIYQFSGMSFCMKH